MSTAEEIKKVVKEKYGAIAAQLSDASSRESASCCGPADCGCGAEVTGPRGGDPTAIAELRRG